jgi:3'-phosphoadenosine 5'-phosphosulfate sulfotransferase (PAPS reductase)/FAD synthetase
MTLDEKIKEAVEIVLANVTHNTVLYCSFGKDSMVMLHLTRSMGLDLPVVFNRIQVFPAKQRFANVVIDAWSLKVYSYPPVDTELCLEPERDLINYYSVGDGKTLMMPVGVRAPKPGEQFSCGLEDFVRAPKGTIAYPWDVAFIGHKSSDVDPLFGEVPLSNVTAQVTPNLKAVFPLAHFTDANIWEYTERFDVPYNSARYDKDNGYREFKDDAGNNDYYPVCTACLEPGGEVHCPKLGVTIPNMNSLITIATPAKMAYMEKANA